MKVVFIDIDGPLAWGTWQDGKVCISEGQSSSLIIPYGWVEEDCAALTEIVNRTGANLVISSDWKLHYGLGQLKQILDYYKMPWQNLIDTTTNYNPVRKLSSPPEWDRACQIKTWVKSFKPESWIAIDDLPLGTSFNRLRIPKWRHVQVRGDYGNGQRLRDKIEECVNKLNK